MRNKRILIALHRLEGGGAERQAAYLAEGLVQRGYSVTVLAFGKREGLALEWFNAIRISPLCTGFSERFLLDYSKSLRSWWLRKKYAHKLIAIVCSLQVNVIIPFTYPPNVIYGILWRKMNVAKCFWNQRDEGRLFLGRSFETTALNHVTTIISNSMAGRNFLEKYTDREVMVIHNGIRQLVTPRAEDHDDLNVVMIANIHKYKDHLTLLKAWKKITRRINNVKLLLAGKEGDAALEVKQYVVENMLADSVSFLGQVNDIPSLLRIVDIGVFSSNNEGVPNGILECMSTGLPVVATRIEGSEEALGVDYQFLSEPSNDTDLFDKLMLLLEDGDLRVKVGKANRERVKRKFSTEIMLDKYLFLIESI